MRFLVDAQLPPVLCRVFTSAGHDCDHVEQAGLLRAEDPDIWRHAARGSAVIVTTDEDFPKLKTLKADDRGALQRTESRWVTV